MRIPRFDKEHKIKYLNNDCGNKGCINCIENACCSIQKAIYKYGRRIVQEQIDKVVL